MNQGYLDKVSNKALGELFLDKGIITDPQLTEALQYSKVHNLRLGGALIQLGYISEDMLSFVLAEQYGVLPIEIQPSMVDAKLVRKFPMEYLTKNHILPLVLFDNTLVVVISDPNSQARVENLRRYLPGVELKVQFAGEEIIRQCLNHVYSLKESSISEDDSYTLRAAVDAFLFQIIDYAEAAGYSSLILRETEIGFRLESDTFDAIQEQISFSFDSTELLKGLDGISQPVEFSDGFWRFVHLDINESFRKTVFIGHASFTYHKIVLQIRLADSVASDPVGETPATLPAYGSVQTAAYTDANTFEGFLTHIPTHLQTPSSCLLFFKYIKKIPNGFSYYPADNINIPKAVQALHSRMILFDYSPEQEELEQILKMMPKEAGVFIGDIGALSSEAN